MDAHVTVRAIQLAFRRHLDTTPLGYLRRIRLYHAHADPRAADPGRGDSVAAIAARWGFAHPGRSPRCTGASSAAPPVPLCTADNLALRRRRPKGCCSMAGALGEGALPRSG
ncbi:MULTISPECIES: helix-turn-helix domain-containing protein [unclassified Nonomuraea]|uniref:helix-turn-helix domain-containing protein n=1 Tax=unclassified Nonomuraea TaxID=2593643 RepID=UPI0033D791C7